MLLQEFLPAHYAPKLYAEVQLAIADSAICYTPLWCFKFSIGQGRGRQHILDNSTAHG